MVMTLIKLRAVEQFHLNLTNGSLHVVTRHTMTGCTLTGEERQLDRSLVS